MRHTLKKYALLKQESGLTLLEMMIALGIGAVLTYAVVSLLKNTGKEATSVSSKNDYLTMVNEMQGVFNNPDRCRAAFLASNTVVPNLDALGLPGDAATVPIPIALNIGNSDAAKGPLSPPYAPGTKWGQSLTITKFEFVGKKSIGDATRNKQFNVPLRLTASRRVGQERSGSETATGGDILQKTFNLVVNIENGKIVGCAGQNKSFWASSKHNLMDIIYTNEAGDDTEGRVAIFDTAQFPDIKTKLDVGGTTQGVAFLNRSDARLKKNVREIPGALERVLKLHGVRFDWKDRSNPLMSSDQLGFLAQEVEAVFPEAVVTSSSTGMKSVAYDNLVGPLVEAIKERQKILLRQQKDLSEIRKAVQKN